VIANEALNVGSTLRRPARETANFTIIAHDDAPLDERCQRKLPARSLAKHRGDSLVGDLTRI